MNSSAPMSMAAPSVRGSPSRSSGPSIVAEPVPWSIVPVEAATWWKSPPAAPAYTGTAVSLSGSAPTAVNVSLPGPVGVAVL